MNRSERVFSPPPHHVGLRTKTEMQGFEPWKRLSPPYPLSRRAPYQTRPHPRVGGEGFEPPGSKTPGLQPGTLPTTFYPPKCSERVLNPHAFSGTRLSTLCVFHFHHPSKVLLPTSRKVATIIFVLKRAWICRDPETRKPRRSRGSAGLQSAIDLVVYVAHPRRPKLESQDRYKEVLDRT